MIRRLKPGHDLKDGCFWVDVTDPNEAELNELATSYGLHPTSVKDCLDPLHLPKFEEIEQTKFIILRHADEKAVPNQLADTVREMTRKIAIFVLPQGVITVHRSPQIWIDYLFDYWDKSPEKTPDSKAYLLNQMLKAVHMSFQQPLAAAEKQFEALEGAVLSKKRTEVLLERLYFLRRKVSVYKKILRGNIEAIGRFSKPGLNGSPYFEDVREEGDRQYFHADELLEDVQSLLSTALNIASHRTNEVIRVLTLFSAFFLPLTFIVGIYGMNFSKMPELQWHYGYPAVWVSMLAVAFAIWGWFKKKGWLF